MTVTKQIQAAISAGATTRREVVLATGLDAGLVDLSLDLMLQTDQISKLTMPKCATTTCGNCIETKTCTPKQVTIQIGKRPGL